MDAAPAHERVSGLIDVIGKGLAGQGIYGQPGADEQTMEVDVAGRTYEVIVRPKS